MLDKIIETINQAINQIFTGIVEGVTQTLGNAVYKIMQKPVDFLNNPIVMNCTLYFQILASSLVVTKVVFEIFNERIINTETDGNGDLIMVIRNSIYSAAVIWSVPWIITKIFEFGSAVANEISKIDGLQNNQLSLSKLLNITTLYQLQLFGVFLAITAIGFIIFIYFQVYVRAATLALYTIISPLISISLAGENKNMFVELMREIVVISLTQALQMITLIGGIYITAQGVGSTNAAENCLQLIAWLWVTKNVPKFLKQFAHSSGASSAIARSAPRMVSQVVNVYKKFAG